MRQPGSEVRKLAAALREVTERVRPCSRCGAYCEAELCGDVRRSVARPQGDLRGRGRQRGGRDRARRAHIAASSTSWEDASPRWTESDPERLRIDALLERIDGDDATVQEVILATNASVEGEATAVYIEDLLRSRPVRVTRLARGIPIGSDLEYVDGTTIAEAFAGRREMSAGS